MTKKDVIKLTERIYVGYNPSYMVDTAVNSATRIFNDKLKINISPEEAKTMMANENVIASGGLDNFLYKLYLKMEATKQKEKMVA